MQWEKTARRREANLSGALSSAPDKLLPPESRFYICHFFFRSFFLLNGFAESGATSTSTRR